MPSPWLNDPSPGQPTGHLWLILGFQGSAPASHTPPVPKQRLLRALFGLTGRQAAQRPASGPMRTEGTQGQQQSGVGRTAARALEALNLLPHKGLQVLSRGHSLPIALNQERGSGRPAPVWAPVPKGKASL